MKIMPTNDDLSPEGINKSHGKPTWKCWGCKATRQLHWHNGWSVAICRKIECGNAYDKMIAGQVAEEHSRAEADAAYFGAKG